MHAYCNAHRLRGTQNLAGFDLMRTSVCPHATKSILPITISITNTKNIHQKLLENVQLRIFMLCHTRLIVILASLTVCRPMYLIADQGGMIY